jgi:L-asparaginase
MNEATEQETQGARTIELITTGGTIEKTYDVTTQTLSNHRSIVHRMIRRLVLPDTSVQVRELMSKDSLELTDEDRETIVRTVEAALGFGDSVVVLHGTDTLGRTGGLLHERLGDRLTAGGGRVVLTGAIRPYEMKRSDALQNLTEALLASTLLEPGVWCVLHSKALRFPGVDKDHGRQTFIANGASRS